MSAPASGQPTDPKIWAIAVWGLYLAGLVSGITALVGLILAYVKRGELAEDAKPVKLGRASRP